MVFLQYTHVKISQLVASLQTSCQQVVFARLVTSCEQVWNKLLTTCNNLVQGRIQTSLTGLYKPVRFSKERKSFTFRGCLLLILGHNSVS